MVVMNQASPYEQTMRKHMDAYLLSNGPIGDGLARRYAGSDLQLGIAWAIARGVWYWNADGPQSRGRRFWRVDEVLAELRERGAVRALDPDNHLGLQTKGVTRVDAGRLMDALRNLARRVKV